MDELQTHMLLDVMHSIDATLKELLALSKSKRAATTVHQPDQLKWTVDLEGPYGDPIIKAKDPRDWDGKPSMLGRHLSECPPDYLDLLAARYDYFAGKETDEKKKRYAVIDAAKARAWAARVRSGYLPKTQNEATDHVIDADSIKW